MNYSNILMFCSCLFLLTSTDVSGSISPTPSFDFADTEPEALTPVASGHAPRVSETGVQTQRQTQNNQRVARWINEVEKETPENKQTDSADDIPINVQKQEFLQLAQNAHDTNMALIKGVAGCLQGEVSVPEKNSDLKSMLHTTHKQFWYDSGWTVLSIIGGVVLPHCFQYTIYDYTPFVLMGGLFARRAVLDFCEGLALESSHALTVITESADETAELQEDQNAEITTLLSLKRMTIQFLWGCHQ